MDGCGLHPHGAIRHGTHAQKGLVVTRERCNTKHDILQDNPYVKAHPNLTQALANRQPVQRSSLKSQPLEVLVT